MAVSELSEASEVREKGSKWPYRVVSLAWQRRLRVWHRRLAIVTAIQLLLWTVSGIYFAFVDITMVRGEPHRLAPPTQSIDLAKFDFPVASTSQVLIKPRLSGEIVVGVTDPESGLTEWLGSDGQPVTPLTSEQAISAVSSKTDITVNVTEWVTTAAEAAEYRGPNFLCGAPTTRKTRLFGSTLILARAILSLSEIWHGEHGISCGCST